MKKPGKTFIRGLVMDGVCASPCAHQFERSSARRRSFASGCGSIRLLRGAIAGYSFGERGTVGFFCVRSALSKPLLYSIKVFGREREGDFFPKKFPSQNPPKNKPQTPDIEYKVFWKGARGRLFFKKSFPRINHKYEKPRKNPRAGGAVRTRVRCLRR